MRLVALASALALLALVPARGAAQARPSEELGDPAASTEAAPPYQEEDEEEPPEPPSFGALWGSGWAGWLSGFGVGASLGLLVGWAGSAACASDAGGLGGCPGLAIGTGAFVTGLAGGMIGAGARLWQVADQHDAGGEGWTALLGAVLLPALATGLAAAIAYPIAGAAADTVVIDVAALASVLFSQLGAALLYEISRSF